MKRLVAAFLAFVSLAIANPALPQDGDETTSDEIVMSAWANPSDCNRSNATHQPYSKLLARYKSLKGKCVAVEGYWQGRALFRGLRDARVSGSNVARGLRHRRIGLYARPELLEAAPIEPERYLIVGLVGECETQWPGAMMVMGYCHYTGGSILLVAEAFKS